MKSKFFQDQKRVKKLSKELIKEVLEHLHNPFPKLLESDRGLPGPLQGR